MDLDDNEVLQQILMRLDKVIERSRKVDEKLSMLENERNEISEFNSSQSPQILKDDALSGSPYINIPNISSSKTTELSQIPPYVNSTPNSLETPKEPKVMVTIDQESLTDILNTITNLRSQISRLTHSQELMREEIERLKESRS